MKNFFESNKNMERDYKVTIMYYLIILVIASSSTFLSIYIFLAPFLPAIAVHVVYILFHISLFYFMKKKHYLFVKIGLLTTYMIQLTLAVYLWFPVTTGYYLFYFMGPIAAFLIVDIYKKSERLFAIVMSVMATVLFLGSAYLEMDFYMYELKIGVQKLIFMFTVVSTIVPASYIFFRYTVDLDKKQKELQHLANTDVLTQVTNRRVLFEQGKKEVYLAEKYGFEFTLIQMDIDHFKSINDSYGHPIGDEVLIQLAQVISLHIRKEDTFSRHGGEEFALILRKTTIESGLEIAHKLRSVIEDNIFKIGEIELKITLSIGVAHYTSGNKSFHEMMLISDKALYQAKDEGRNCVIMGKI